MANSLNLHRNGASLLANPFGVGFKQANVHYEVPDHGSTPAPNTIGTIPINTDLTTYETIRFMSLTRHKISDGSDNAHGLE